MCIYGMVELVESKLQHVRKISNMNLQTFEMGPFLMKYIKDFAVLCFGAVMLPKFIGFTNCIHNYIDQGYFVAVGLILWFLHWKGNNFVP